MASPLDIIKGRIQKCFFAFLSVIEHEHEAHEDEDLANMFACIAAVAEVALVSLIVYLCDADLIYVICWAAGGCNSRVFPASKYNIAHNAWVVSTLCGWNDSIPRVEKHRREGILKSICPFGCRLFVGIRRMGSFDNICGSPWPWTSRSCSLGRAWFCLECCFRVFSFGYAGEVRVRVSYQMFMGLVTALIISTIFLSLINILPSFLTTDQTIQGMLRLRMVLPLIALGDVTMSVGMV